MNLIDLVRKDERLKTFLSKKCTEKKVSLQVTNLDYQTIKLDNFYRDLNLAQPPATPDCLTVIKCEKGRFKVLISELKSGDFEDVTPKFITALVDFMSIRFSSIFMPEGKVRFDLQLLCVQNRASRKSSVRKQMLNEIKWEGRKLFIIEVKSPFEVLDCAPIRQK
jgi:hypothetical protein